MTIAVYIFLMLFGMYIILNSKKIVYKQKSSAKNEISTPLISKNLDKRCLLLRIEAFIITVGSLGLLIHHLTTLM